MKILKSLRYFALISLLLAVATSGTGYGAGNTFKPGFSLRLYGGFDYVKDGDLNAGLKGYSDSEIYYYSFFGYSHAGKYQDMHFGMEAGGDLVFQFSPYFGLGVGAGYSQASKDSTITLTGPGTGKHILKPKVSAVPLRVSFFFFLPLSDVFKISLNAGAGYYLASVGADIRREMPTWWDEYEQKANGQGLGFQGGLGLEIRLTGPISLILEGQGRYARIGQLKGTKIIRSSSGGQTKEEGTLYYWTDVYLFRPFPYIFIESSKPSDPWQQDVRKAVVDLTGGSVRGGFLFRF